MDNFDLKKYLKNNPLLNEIKVNNPIVSPEEVANLYINLGWPSDKMIKKDYWKFMDKITNKKWILPKEWFKILYEKDKNLFYKAYKDLKQIEKEKNG